jgi:hypothetical protein
MAQITAAISDHHRALEPESVFQPIQGCEWLLVEHRSGESRTSISIWHGSITSFTLEEIVNR